MTQKATDTKNTPRGIGNYVIGEPTTGLGIRRYPYCYDMSVNPQTYGDLNFDEDIYLNGEVWASAVWDMYWELVEAHGYTADLYNGTGGNVRALKLVIEGLKQQPCNPGLLDGRNAILKADSILYNKANTCLIWKAFARRGMGASALQGSNLSAPIVLFLQEKQSIFKLIWAKLTSIISAQVTTTTPTNSFRAKSPA